MDTPYTNASDLSFWESLRATFYIVTPSETVFEYPKQVPNYVAAAIPHFTILVLLETAILVWKGKRNLRINDKITSMGAGIYSEVLGILGLKTIGFSIYSYVYTHYRVYELPWDSTWTWIFMALTYDFLYYWFHRMAHEVSFLWLHHQTHHSSEDYALPTALRQSATQTYTSMFFYVPAALLVPPSSYLVHRQLNLLYQFWIHTELVDSIGPLEHILNTPSHHRVHHGRNPYCIDKNYAAVLIIWDRMFGTFAAERKDEKVVYGLVHPVNTFDSIGIQVGHYIPFAKRIREAKGFRNKMSSFFKGPGWIPGSPRLGNPEDLPKIENPVKVYDPQISHWITAYVVLHYIISLTIYTSAANRNHAIPAPVVVGCSIFILVTLTCVGYIFDKRSFAYTAECSRCLVCSLVINLYRGDIINHLLIAEPVLNVVSGIFLLSAMIWPLLIFRGGMKVFKEKTA